MTIQTLRVNNELLSIVNHTGLNPDDTVEVETGVSGRKFVSIISGVDVRLAYIEVTRYLDGRSDVSVKSDNTATYLIVTQPYRE